MPSKLPLTIRRPSGEKAIELTFVSLQSTRACVCTTGEVAAIAVGPNCGERKPANECLGSFTKYNEETRFSNIDFYRKVIWRENRPPTSTCPQRQSIGFGRQQLGADQLVALSYARSELRNRVLFHSHFGGSDLLKRPCDRRPGQSCFGV
jgi:hypothetical protein